LSSGLRGTRAWQAAQESACGRRSTGCDGGLGLGTNSRVSHEALVVVLLHDEGKGTLELKAGDLREVGDVGEVVVSEAVDAADITGAQNCEDAFVELVGAKPLDDGDAGAWVIEGHDAGPSCGGLPQRRQLRGRPAVGRVDDVRQALVKQQRGQCVGDGPEVSCNPHVVE
jgi:hypothetical protein